MAGPSKPFQAGDIIACYEILGIITDASSGHHRRYWAKAACCGLVVNRAEHSFRDAKRHGRDCCHRCARQRANLNLTASYGYLERFGSTRILARGEETKTWRVVWDCCGKESVLSQTYINMMKKAVVNGKPAPICLECSIERARLLAKEREKPTRQSRRKADLLAMREGRPVPPPPVGIIKAHEAPQKPLVLKPMGAELPPGIIPAAMAWPRPGRASA